MTEEKILTKHPGSKSGRNINKKNYDFIKQTMLQILADRELTHTEIFYQLNEKLKNNFSGNVNWYGEIVKLDLEARKIIKRTSSKPQKYKLK